MKARILALGVAAILVCAAAPAAQSESKKKSSPTNAGCATFTFDATDSYDNENQNLKFKWDFGDGTTSEKAVARHSYAAEGEYLVTLVAVDNSGLVCDTAVTTTRVKVNLPPVANFVLPESACVGDTVVLDGSASTDTRSEELAYEWTFNGGDAVAGKKTMWTFEKGGRYKILLTVDDQNGGECAVGRAEKTLQVNTPPIARIGKDSSWCTQPDVEEFRIRFDAGNSEDADRDKLSYRWDFGDGNSGEGARLVHHYKRPGTYAVSLSVDDGSDTRCNTDVDTVIVTLNRRPEAVAGEDVQACPGIPVVFDGSASRGDEDLAFRWKFGDGGSAAGAEAEHVYESGGNYEAVLTVDDGKDSDCSAAEDSVKVHVNHPPEVKVMDVKDVCIGKTMQFEVEASDGDGDRLRIHWDFGDGTRKTGGSQASHRYSKSGYYAVSVTADDNRDMSCSITTGSVYFKVNSPPVADAGKNLACCVDRPVDFDASGTYDPDQHDKLTYNWDFGDGNTVEGAKVEHTYIGPGVYDVLLTVDDGSGSTCSKDTAGFKAQVNTKPVPIIKVR